MPPRKNRDEKTKNEKNSSRSGKETTQSRSRRRSEGSIQRSSTRTRTVAAGSVSQSAYPELGSPVDVDDLPVDSTIPRASRRPFSSRGYGPEEQQHIQRAVEGTDTRPSNIPEPVLDVLGSGGGQPLDQPIQRALEDRMEADFGNVRIHTGPKAAQAADAIDAKAFTCGNDVVFNSGEYDPESPDGQFLLAHELAHVKQQNGGAPISMMPQEGADLEIDPDPQLEREADQAAQQALSSDEPLVVNRMGTDVHVQRAPKNKDALETLAMLEIENEEEDHSDFRETQNQNRIQYLRETINEVYSETNTVDDAEDISELEKRLRFKELNEKLDDKVTDVGLTEDQQKKLERKIDTGEWLDYGTPVAAFLSARVIEPLAGLVTGLGITALKKKFGSLDGDIEERFEKLTRQLEEEGYLTGDDLEGVGSSGEVTDQ